MSTCNVSLRRTALYLPVGMGGLTFLFFLWLLGAPVPVSGSDLSSPTASYTTAQHAHPLAVPNPMGARQAVTPAVQLTVTPPIPTLAQAITISAGDIWPDGCVPVYKSHQVTANHIKIDATTPVGEPCGQVVTPWALSVVLDPLPTGIYTVDLLIVGDDGTEGLTYTTTFTVTLTPSTQVITSTGGALVHHDRGQRATLVVAPGSVVTSTRFTMRYQPAPITTGPLLPIGHVVALTATPTSLTKPFTLTLRYSDTVRGPVIADTVQLYRLQSGQWVTAGITITARLTDGLTAQITQLSLYGLLGRSNRLYWPIARHYVNVQK